MVRNSVLTAGVMACLLAAMVSAGVALAQTPVNLLPNPGFEEDRNGDGLPDKWRVKPDKHQARKPVTFDKAEKHGGIQSVRICHQRSAGYSKVRTVCAVKPYTNYTATVWIKVDGKDPIQPGIEKSQGVNLLIQNLDTKPQRIMAHAGSALTTFGKWQRRTAKFNSGRTKRILFLLYLHNARGTVWMDDAELVEGTEPTQPAGQAAAFPTVDLLPGTAAMHKAFYLIQGEPTHLALYYLGDQSTAKGLELVLDVPEGIALTKDFRAASDPSGTPVGRGEKRYLRHVRRVPANRVRPKVAGHKHAHILIFEASGSSRSGGVIYWHLRRGDMKDEERQLAVTVLPPLAPLKAVPAKFEIFTFHQMPLRLCPAGEQNDRLLERMHQLSIKSGIRGAVLPPVSPERASRLIRERSWANGIMVGWVSEPERHMTAQSLKEAQAVDAHGKDYPGAWTLCPTYCIEHNVFEHLAEWGFQCSYGRRAHAQTLKKGDWYVLDFEPGWRKCYCHRCLKAFSGHSGIPRERLNPPEIPAKLTEEWTRFRDWQKAQALSRFNDAVKKISPKLRFGLCDEPNETWSRSVVDPCIDFHCPMVYWLHPRKFFDVVEEEKQRVGKPFLPTIETKMFGVTCWTSPKELKLKILSAAAAGARGIMIWPGTDSLGALDLAKIRECSDALVKLETYYFSGQRKDDGVTVRPAEKGYIHYGHRAHELGRRRLLTLFNFHSRKPATFSVNVAQISAGDYGVSDPVTHTAFLTPAGGRRTWNNTDLRAGFSLEVPPYEVAFILVEPAGQADAAQRTRKLQKAVGRGAASTPHLLEIPKVTTPPAIDGKLSEPMWKTAGLATGFVHAEDLAEAQTVVRVAYDEQNLYVGFECLEPRMSKLVAKHTERDSTVWADDCAEVFLRARADTCHHFIVNPAGALHDSRGSLGIGKVMNVKWNSNVRRATSRGKRSWIVELAIPFADLETGKPRPGDVWGLNLCRSRVAELEGKKYDKDKQASSWFPTFGCFINPPKFGQMKFLGAR